ncbi:RNA-binding domain-containing protein [Bifidobacterium sp. ESL0790]|uniref:RNA-binding domain-containing protein n=1 Tax=Bifidobacterium sp. ESL0790 TaxID=2983233 RepID=UPI0023F82E9B|nr:RNA-binding domain-containing protein [Bifidobacterium sp. ESL0790]WEV73255.1 putative DNA binding domain-containing protein [Bifidobacterium sp. ESL0790]
MPSSFGHETLEREFKSDRKQLPDESIVEAVVALANTEGGTLFLGVEDDGTPTGVHEKHRDVTRLNAFIANKTVPPIAARVNVIGEPPVIAIEVSKSTTVVATKSGKVLRRRLKADGSPESVPMYPYELATRLSDLGRLDYSAQPVPDTSISDFDPLELDRLRRIISTYKNSDKALLDLSDEELEQALRLTVHVGGQIVPTLTGMLFLGKTEVLHRAIPTNEAAFQVLQGTDIRVNKTFDGPLLKTIEQITDALEPWNPQTEVSIGLFSEPVPDFDNRAFREALINAFGHRDYSVLGRVRVQVDDAGLLISNPGGFVEGIDLNNLLTAEPRGRNPELMDALKRVGLAERTGRGIDRIFEGSLNYGRPLPDYSRSNDVGVSVFLARSAPDANFVRMLAEEHDRTGNPMSLEALLVLNMLKSQRRCTFETLNGELEMSASRLHAVVGKLVESGLVEASGSGKRRAYFLGSNVYKRSGKTVEYVRQADIAKVRYPELIMNLAKQQGKDGITVSDVMQLLRIEYHPAYYQIQKMVRNGKLKRLPHGRTGRYIVT